MSNRYHYQKYKHLYLNLKQGLVGGNGIPKLCLGTVQGSGSRVGVYLEKAYDLGYRHFDGADGYNRDGYMESLRDFLGNHDRSNLWITWKGNDPSRIESTLKQLGIEYFNLYLIHHDYSCNAELKLVQLEDLKKEGLINQYGISNCYRVDRLIEYKKQFPDLSVLQIQAKPNLDLLIESMNKLGIEVMLFAPISGVMQAMGSEIDYSALEHISGLFAWYVQKYPMATIMVGTTTGNSLEVNMTQFKNIKVGNKVLDMEGFQNIEKFLLENVENLAHM